VGEEEEKNQEWDGQFCVRIVLVWKITKTPKGEKATESSERGEEELDEEEKEDNIERRRQEEEEGSGGVCLKTWQPLHRI
jgi:hypothetical protein